jgi:hypothetical protein
MATGETGAVNRPSPIMRSLRSGVAPTAGSRFAAPAAAQAQATAKINLDSGHPAASSPAVAGAAPEVAGAGESIALPNPRPEIGAPKSRFGKLTAKPANPDEEVGPAVVEPAAGGRFGSLVDHDRSVAAKGARINMAAVKALTPLVASISFFPGASAEPTMKSSALANLIVKVQKAASDIVLAMGPTTSNVDWARGQVMQELAKIAAKQWETSGRVDLESAVTQMMAVLRTPSVELQSALDSYAGADAYMEARTPDVAKARLSVSVSSAAWELYDWMTRESLRLKDQPSKVFSYDRPIDDVVELVLGRVIDEARGMQIQVNSADLQLSHLQGSIRRLVQLAGAEYVTQTNAIIAWIDSSDIESAERDRRLSAAVEQFETHVVPRIMEYVHVNFAGIEHRARKLMEEPGGDAAGAKDSNRPA